MQFHSMVHDPKCPQTTMLAALRTRAQGEPDIICATVPAAGRVTGTGCFRGCATGSPHKVPSATPAWRRRSPPPPPVGRAPACAWWYCRGGAAGSRLQAPSAAQAWRRRHLPSADAVTTTASPSSSYAHRDHKIFTRSTYKKGIHIFYFLH